MAGAVQSSGSPSPRLAESLNAGMVLLQLRTSLPPSSSSHQPGSCSSPSLERVLQSGHSWRRLSPLLLLPGSKRHRFPEDSLRAGAGRERSTANRPSRFCWKSKEKPLCRRAAPSCSDGPRLFAP